MGAELADAVFTSVTQAGTEHTIAVLPTVEVTTSPWRRNEWEQLRVTGPATRWGSLCVEVSAPVGGPVRVGWL